MKENQTQTAKRVYYTVNQDGIWNAYYQPLNPATRTPWQASQRIMRGHDCHRLGNREVTTGIVSGPAPADWLERGEFTRCLCGFSSEALALAAIADEKARSKK
jgi:hypothetical protein